MKVYQECLFCIAHAGGVALNIYACYHIKKKHNLKRPLSFGLFTNAMVSCLLNGCVGAGQLSRWIWPDSTWACKISYSAGLGVLGLPWLTAFLSIVRYLINYQSTNEIPHKEIKKWYLMSTGVISCLVGIIVSYHLVTESDLLTDFCTLVNSSDPSFVTTLVTKDAIRFVHVLIFLIGACLGFTFDVLFKCFVNWQTNEGEELGIDIQNIDNSIPLKATVISMSTMLFASLTFGSKYIVGTWFALLLTGLLLAIPVPVVAFITLNATTSSKVNQVQEAAGARINSEFAEGFPHHEVKSGSPVFVKRVTWSLELEKPRQVQEFDLKQMLADRHQFNLAKDQNYRETWDKRIKQERKASSSVITSSTS